MRGGEKMSFITIVLLAIFLISVLVFTSSFFNQNRAIRDKLQKVSLVAIAASLAAIFLSLICYAAYITYIFNF